MNKELSSFAAQLREHISSEGRVTRVPESKFRDGDSQISSLRINPAFNQFALGLFALQFKYNAAYQKICQARGATPEVVGDWTQIPAVPTEAFKELELSCLPPDERTSVFHSSGTTEQKPSRHHHCGESLELYEASLWQWFECNVLSNLRFTICDLRLVCLAPSPSQAPHSSLVHMFETIRSRAGESADRSFYGTVTADGSWILDFDAVTSALKSAIGNRQPTFLLGTAFSFVHLLDFMSEHKLRFQLPAGSRVMETGGYKNRSRTMPKEDLHALLTNHLGLPGENIICEYGMSELSSQAYDNVKYGSVLPHPGPLPKERENCRQSAGETLVAGNSNGRTLRFPLPAGEGQGEGKRSVNPRNFHFPPWARAQIISPETGREVEDGETGLIRVFDLANVFSVMAVQAEDLGVRHGDGFELIGRAQFAEPRGCSLMTADL